MTCRSVVIALVALLAVSQPSFGQGNSNGNNGSQGSANGNGNGNGQNSAGQNNGNGQGNGTGVIEAPTAEPTAGSLPNPATGQGGGLTGTSPTGSVGQTNGELSESSALASVQAGRAVPLEVLLPDVRTRTGGEVINARLQQVGAFLIYAVTVMTPEGKVITEHYYARTGLHVE